MNYRVALLIVSLLFLIGCQAGQSYVDGIAGKPKPIATPESPPEPANDAAHDLGVQTRDTLENSGPYGNLILAGLTIGAGFLAKRERKKRKDSDNRRQKAADELQQLASHDSEESPLGTIWIDSRDKTEGLIKTLKGV